MPPVDVATGCDPYLVADFMDRLLVTTNPQDIHSTLLQFCAEKFAIQRGAVVFYHHHHLSLKASLGLRDPLQPPLPTLCPITLLEDPNFRSFTSAHGLAIQQPIHSGDELRGVILLGHDDEALPESHRSTLAILAKMMIVTLDYQRLLRRQNKSVREQRSRLGQLQSLLELSKGFGGTLEEDTLSQLLIFSLVTELGMSRFAVALLKSDDTLRILEDRGFDWHQEDLLQVKLGAVHQPILKGAIQKDYPFLAAREVELLVPMQIQGRTCGAILLGPRRDHKPYQSPDVHFVEILGTLAIIALENLRLVGEVIARQRLDQELRTAREIQQNLLPHPLPQMTGIDMAACSLPAMDVGGDYYDVICLDEQRLLFAIGDASGKGVHSALLMANVQAFLKALCRGSFELAEATTMINGFVAESTVPEMFVTFLWGIIDCHTRQLHYVNAGHDPLLLVRNGQIQHMNQGGIVLGALDPAPPFATGQATLEPGDLLVAYTDGITEALNLDNQTYGSERFEHWLQTIDHTADSEQLLQSLVSEIRHFEKDTPQADDITCMMLRIH